MLTKHRLEGVDAFQSFFRGGMHANDFAVEDGRTRRAVNDSGRGLDRLAGGGRRGLGGAHVLRLSLADDRRREHHNIFLHRRKEQVQEGRVRS